MGLPPAQDLESHWVRARDEGADPTYLEPLRGGYTGVVGVLRNGDGPTLGLRFDIDALNLVESEAASHRPAAEGFRSIHQNVCHACGHDGHAATGLGIAHVLSELRSHISGTVKLIFQPAEEGVRGARSMVVAGVVDDVDLLLGHHLVTGAAVGELFPGMSGYAATTKFDVEFQGEPAHAGGSPDGGHNALLSAATAALNLQALPRHREGFTRINVGQLIAGTGRNVIPAQAKLVVEVRGETSALCESMYDRALAIVYSAAAMHGCTSTVRIMGGAGTASSDDALADRVQSIASQLEKTVFHRLEKIGGSEDFTEMMTRVQDRGGLATNIGIGADFGGHRHGESDRSQVLPAHTGVYDFDENALGFATRLLSLLTLELANATPL